ncbi:MAG: multidrug effflux MFS transporter [Gammaproteobacteria bacterium]|jgi:Bcr/CflA subfamily drug resistance transporter
MKRDSLILFLVILVITIGQSVDVYLPSMPSMAVALNTSVQLIQLTITIAMIAFGIALFVYGPLSDYFGRRKVALFGIGFFVAGSVLCVFAINVTMLIIGRVIQGIGIACAGAIAPAALRDTFTGPKLAKAFSQVSMVLAITPVVAPILGGYLQYNFDWRAPFIFLFLYSFIIFLLYLFLFPETNKQLKQSVIHPKLVIKDYAFMFVNVKYLALVFCFVFVFAGEISYAIVAPFLYQSKLGLTSVANGWLIFLTVFGYLLGSFASLRLCAKLNALQLITIGAYFAFLGGAIMLVLAWLNLFSVVVILIPMIIFMFGAGLIYPNVIAAGMSCYSEKSGMAGSVMSALQIGGGGIIASVMSRIRINNQLPLAILLVGLSVLTIIMVLVLKAQTPRNAQL